MSEVNIMKTIINTDSTIYTRNNIIVLMAGFLTPVILFSALAVSIYKRNSEAKTESAQTVTVENVAIADEMYAAPYTYINEEVEFTPDAGKICLKDDLLPRFSRF